jgi:hypothetical protein
LNDAHAVRVILLLLVSCSKPPTIQPADVGVDTYVAPKPDAPTNVKLDDACKKHDDCAAIELFVDGPLRCCIACGAQASANKESADAFIAMCAHDRETRECPVYNCKAEVLDPKCVGGHCQLAPRPR